ncbi:sensor histidine kinase [Gynuella sunshinyii]|uniref:histidine kinase n=1 Tax=Gynuella sunshinyii YC6258 TaxID=1445510 RepID=A0A0C5VVT1_9GAMM|nr:ATP-binding protein [Gynuella sunshinyii]AJQ97418.1 osmosensitive K+ channel histidine kinase [Gynuella sunshinyii YC6258]
MENQTVSITNLSRRRQNVLMSFFNLYRIALASLLFLMIQLGWLSFSFSIENARETIIVSLGFYLVLCAIAIAITVKQLLSQTSVLAIMITDIMLLTLALKTIGGVTSGLGNLIIVSVAVGTLFLSFRNSLLLAAFATSSVVYTELLSGIAPNNPQQAAFLGLAFFATTIVIQYLMSRTRSSEKLAEIQAENILSLEATNQLILQRMHTGIIVSSIKGIIHTSNQAAARLITDSETESIQNKKLPPVICELLQQWLNQEHIASHIVKIHPKMPEVFVNFTSLQNNKNSDVIIFMEDTSKTAQQAQQLKLASLGRFTASIAHEIRNPLGAISHAAQLLEESPNIDQTDSRMIQIIKNHSQRMNTIIENILQLSRRAESNAEIINLKDWLMEFLVIFQEAHKDARIETRVADDLMIKFDPSHLQQVLTNLISNGLRYSKMAGNRCEVEIVAGILNANNQPYLDVIDFGPGISAENRDKLFEPFFTTEKTGTGLGLFLTKELCEANQSQIMLAESTEQDPSATIGCCFRILFSHPNRLTYME